MKNTKIGILILAFITVFGCKQTMESKTTGLTKSGFKIKEDYIDFADKMENDDTLNLGVNLSMCMWEEFDRIEITKTNDSLYLQIKEKIISDDQPINFPKVLYEFKNDSLTLEKMMVNFDVNYTEKISSPFFIITSPKEKDTILLRTTGLGNRGTNVFEYQSLMMELYPKEMASHYNTYFGMTFRELNQGTINEE